MATAARARGPRLRRGARRLGRPLPVTHRATRSAPPTSSASPPAPTPGRCRHHVAERRSRSAAVGALAGGLVTALIVYLLAYRRGVHGFRLIIVGIGVTAILQSANTLLLLPRQHRGGHGGVVLGRRLALAGRLGASSCRSRSLLAALTPAVFLASAAAAPARARRRRRTRRTASASNASRLTLLVLGVALIALVTATSRADRLRRPARLRRSRTGSPARAGIAARRLGAGRRRCSC